MLCSPPPATTLASSCAGSEGFCAPCCRRSSQRSRIHNRPKTGRTLLLHERLICEGLLTRQASCEPGKIWNGRKPPDSTFRRDDPERRLSLIQRSSSRPRRGGSSRPQLTLGLDCDHVGLRPRIRHESAACHTG